MALDGTSFGKWADRFASFASGQVALVLTPVAGGDLVPFVHQNEKTEAEATEAGLLRMGVLEVMVRARLAVGAKYTYRGFTWQVALTEDDVMAGTDWPHRAELVRHAA